MVGEEWVVVVVIDSIVEPLIRGAGWALYSKTRLSIYRFSVLTHEL
jgi:hypothetical protein